MRRDAVWIDVERFVPDAETENALLVELADGREVWVPFSQLEKTERRPDGSGRILITAWFARKEDL